MRRLVASLKIRITVLLVIGLGCVFLLTLIAIVVGSTPLGISKVVEVMLSGSNESPVSRIVLDLRLPRALLATIIGAGLGMVGCVLQTAYPNCFEF